MEPKYKIGQLVWMMEENKASENEVDVITLHRIIAEGVDKTKTEYHLIRKDKEYDALEVGTFLEENLFPTKESLLASL